MIYRMNSLLFFKSLSDITRIRLLNILNNHELGVNEIVSLLNMGQPRISRSLKILTDAGLLECRRDGIWAFYSAVKNGSGGKFIKSIQYLFENDELFKQDLKFAEKVIHDRSLKTVHFFNSIASQWDALKQEILGNFDLNTVILDQIEPCECAVDLGCGTGGLLSGLKNKASTVIGVDSSARMINEAKNRFQDSIDTINIRLGEMEHLPLRNKEADCAVISMVLHHLSNPYTAIAEVNRILKQDGIFIIVDFEKHKSEVMRNTYGDRWLGFTDSEIRQWLKRNKFTNISSESYKLKKSLKLSIYKSIKNNS